jgi:hypothetical protein
VNTGGPYTVAAGGTVQLLGSGTGGVGAGTTPAILWTVSSGSLSNAAIYDPIFTAAGAVSPVTATVSASACGATVSASTTITISAAVQPTVNHVLPITVFAGGPVSIPVTGTDPNVPAQALTFAVTQTGAPALLGLGVIPTGPSSGTVTAAAPVLPVGQTLPTTINLTITATNAGGATSLAEFTTVTVQPLPDLVAVTAAGYRLNKQRLDITATSTVVSPNVVLTLQPYLTATGVTFNPSPLGNVFTNTGGGIYTLTLVGAPEPAIPPAAPIFVKSNLGGTSPATRVAIR